jgi:hypothetical protein
MRITGQRSLGRAMSGFISVLAPTAVRYEYLDVYVRFGVFTAVTMKNAVFWDIKTQFVPHRRHYVSLESSQLILCRISSFHSGDYEECRLLGYKNPVRTSQETHYVSLESS